MRATALAALVLMTAPARADGVYFSESFGVGMGRGELAPTVGNTIHSHVALGARVKWLSLEGFLVSDLQFEREGAFKSFVGGEPADGRADIEAYGFALKAIAPLYRSPNGEILEGYLRSGPSLVAGTGMLEGYRGKAIGASAGVQLTGKVRALGFLWAPLFLLKKGPKVTGSLYLDQGWELVRMTKPGARSIEARVGHVSIGFAVGTAF